ncbi:hypothetical protein RUM43_013166, partial [Polyplax serrata]
MERWKQERRPTRKKERWKKSHVHDDFSLKADVLFPQKIFPGENFPVDVPENCQTEKNF